MLNMNTQDISRKCHKFELLVLMFWSHLILAVASFIMYCMELA